MLEYLDQIGYKRPLLRKPENKMSMVEWDEYYKNNILLHKRNIK